MVDKCPYCGKEYPMVEIPGLFGGQPRTIRSAVCGCQGETDRRREEERRERQAALRAAWEATGVPARYMDLAPDFDGLDVSGRKGGLYIYGPRGTGKTRRACAILKAHVARETDTDGRCRAGFVSLPEWLASMRGSSMGQEEERAYNRAASRDLLVLDDMGKGKPTQWALERLFRLVDDRYTKMRPTVYTSQYGLGELARRLGGDDPETAEAIVSRIMETCTGVLMDGPDRRKI